MLLNRCHLYQAIKANDTTFTFLRYVHSELFWKKWDYSKPVWQGGEDVLSIEDAIKQNDAIFYQGENLYDKDMKQCWLAYRISPWEYCMFDFAHRTTYKERNSFLSMVRRNELLTYAMRNDLDHLEDKSKYSSYLLLKQYFKRECFLLTDDLDIDDLWVNVKKLCRLFAKPVNACSGNGAKIIEFDSKMCFESIIQTLLGLSNKWILEELIDQDDRISCLNSSSVNTIRIPSFRTKNGVCLLEPSIRMGRQGSCVDNAGAGGIITSVDGKTGRINYHAIDYQGNKYYEHPDSHVKLNGWQVPQWDDLLKLVK